MKKGFLTTDKRLHLFKADLFGYPTDGTADGTTSSNPVYNECFLWVCIQYYNTAVRNGEQYEEIVDVNDEIGFEYVRDEESWIPVGNESTNDPHYAASQAAVVVLTTLIDTSLYGTIDEGQLRTTDGSDFLPWLWLHNTADADAWIKNAATGITNVIRSDS